MLGHPFREAPPESAGGAHCVRCGQQRPRIELGLDGDGSVICAECRPPAPGWARSPEAADLAESLTKKLLGVLLALAAITWFISRCGR